MRLLVTRKAAMYLWLEILAKISLRKSAGKCNSNRAIYLFGLHVTVVGRCGLAFSAQTRINPADYTCVNNNKQFRGALHIPVFIFQRCNCMRTGARKEEIFVLCCLQIKRGFIINGSLSHFQKVKPS